MRRCVCPVLAIRDWGIEQREMLPNIETLCEKAANRGLPNDLHDMLIVLHGEIAEQAEGREGERGPKELNERIVQLRAVVVRLAESMGLALT